MALVYPTEQMRRLKLVSLPYENTECYILFRGVPNRFDVMQETPMNVHEKESDDRVGYLAFQWIWEES